MIPNELKNVPQWVNWKIVDDENRPGKVKKIPVNPRTNGQAQSNNPSTWSDYQTAEKNSKNIGFMFGNGYFGVDIDDIEDDIYEFKNGDTDNIVYEFVYALKSYAELSISGKGLHIICKGKLPSAGRRKANVEMYSSGRFFIMTGTSVSEFNEINDCTDSIKPLHDKYIGTKSQVQNKIVPMNLSERDIVNLALQSKNGNAFKILWEGNWEGFYQSQSDADLALCNHLAFWCQCNESQMDVLFRKSGLMREKWDRRQSGTTYGAITISKAVSSCKNTYNPTPKYEIFIEKQEVKKKNYSMDDTGNAERFKDLMGESLRYCYTNKTWMYFNGLKWIDDCRGQIKTLADEVINKMKLEFAMCEDADVEKAFMKHLKHTRSSKGKTAMIKELEHMVPILVDEMDLCLEHLNVQNGILNLMTGDLKNHDKNKYFTRVTNVEYTENVDCPVWDKFLIDIFENDKDLIRYIQKAIGYSLTGLTTEQCAFFCYGTGRNGKSTFLDVISDILGDYAVNIQPETIMVKQGNQNGANSDIARLKGARFVTTVEPNDGVRLNEGLIKQLTGGDTVTARKLYANEFEFKPEFKLWMSTNHKPIIRGTDLGIWRRIHLIPFNVKISEEKADKNLKLKLKQEYMGIIRWAVDGCLMWQREGLIIPDSIKQATNEYKNEMDVISAWIDECCELDASSFEKAGDLYNSYSKWGKESNEYVMSLTKFGREMSKKFAKEKLRTNYIYSGIKLIDKPYSISIVK